MLVTLAFTIILVFGANKSDGGTLNCHNDGSFVANPYNISWNQFMMGVVSNGFTPPTIKNYNRFVNRAPRIGNVASKTEMAMLLAQILHESGGFKYRVEIGCPSDPHCQNYQYPNWNPFSCGPSRQEPCKQFPYIGKLYFGRGFMQLSWPVNYDAASWFLFNDDRLWTNPDQISTSNILSWDTSLWYWRTSVHNQPGISEGKFGASTKAINGYIECRSGGTQSARKRFEYYSKVYQAFSLAGSPDETGCYN